VTILNPLVRYADNRDNDAFGRLRVSLPKLQLSAITDTSKRALYWDESLTGTGASAFDSTEGVVNLTVAASGDIAVRQTKEYFVYRAGQSKEVFVSFCMLTGDANVQQDVGYFDDDDGMFFRRVDTTYSMVLRSNTTGSPVDTAVVQSSWNIDKLDGTGESGLTLDPTKEQILVLDFQALFSGRVRMGFDLDGEIIYAHEFLNANTTLTGPYIRRAKLPIRYRIEATGVPGATRTLKCVCATVLKEGGADEPNPKYEGRSNADVNVATAWETVLGLHLNSTNIRATVRLLKAVLFNLDADWVEYCVVLNPSYSGSPTWESIDSDNAGEISRFNAAISVNASGDPDVGHVYPLGGFAPGTGGGGAANESSPESTEVASTVPLVADIAGTSDEVWLCARASTGTANVRGLLAWREER